MEQPEKKKGGLIHWIKEYGYYYKGALFVGIIVAIIIFVVISTVNYSGSDMHLFFVVENELSNEDYNTVYNNASKFTHDTDGDSMTLLKLSRYPIHDQDRLKELHKIYEDEYTIFFICDEAGFEYLEQNYKLRELSFYNIVSDHPYKLRVDNSVLMEGCKNEANEPYYMVFKYIEPEAYESFYVGAYTDVALGIALNIDQSSTNDVDLISDTES